jgi:uncharacterized protein (DUF1800 family)
VNPSLSPEEAWQELPGGDWDLDAARHLLRRAGWTASAASAETAAREGLGPTLDRLFPAMPEFWPMPESVGQFESQRIAGLPSELRAPPGEKRLLQKEERERAQAALQDMSIRWLRFAALPENAPFAKWVLMLSDVYVVAAEKVRNPYFLYRHFDILARGALGRAPDLSKAVSRSPAMVIYLDLNENRRGAPNENFARELFELFLLGEGHYSENDIKEAARAFTGYRVRPALGDFAFARNQHDGGLKTVFGRTGPFTGDEVIDLAYGLQPAEVRLPRKLAGFYLSDEPLPGAHLAALGSQWREDGDFRLHWLARKFFGSRIFFAPEFRGRFIKSPFQYYLGLLQDLDLAVVPLPRYALGPLRQMGQVPFNPPNVRGWLGGRNWINSSTLAARRNLVEMLFAPINPEVLNADEQRVLAGESAQGWGPMTVGESQLAPIEALDPGAAASRIAGSYPAVAPRLEFTRALGEFIAGGADEPGRRLRCRRAVATVLESPEYQLC